QLGSVIEINEWVDECEVAWVSVSGLDHRGRFTLRDGDDDDQTRLRFRLTYTAPGGLVGWAAGRLAQPMLQDSVARTVRAIKHHAEGVTELVPREPLPSRLTRAAGEVVDAAEAVTVLRRAGMLRLFGPGVVPETLRALRKFGFTIPTAVAAA